MKARHGLMPEGSLDGQYWGSVGPNRSEIFNFFIGAPVRDFSFYNGPVPVLDFSNFLGPGPQVPGPDRDRLVPRGFLESIRILLISK